MGEGERENNNTGMLIYDWYHLRTNYNMNVDFPNILNKLKELEIIYVGRGKALFTSI